MRPRVHVAYTGGTIGMRGTDRGYEPGGSLEEALGTVPGLSDPAVPEFDLEEYRPVLDSSNMRPLDWLRIARGIAERYDEYDGFVVLHGTDTMAYTASALAFILRGLAKPVVLTGSQIPLTAPRTDARSNLVNSLAIAANFRVPEVTLFFGTTLLRGCRAVKVNAEGFDAFDSPNFPPLGIAGADIAIQTELLRPYPGGAVALSVPDDLKATVGALRLFPGIVAETVRNALRPPLQGLVLEAYGAGNAPDRDGDLLEAIHEATERGVVVVDRTQCLKGSVDLEAYATGSSLLRAGEISGHDMTAEAALAKLFYLIGVGHSPDEIRALMQEDLCGELTRTAA